MSNTDPVLEPEYDTLQDGTPEMTLSNELSALASDWSDLQELSMEIYKRDFI